MTFPSVQSSSGGSTGNGTTPAFVLPASISAGDLILVIAGTDNTASLTIPSGFTAITQDDASTFQAHVFAKIASGTEGGTSPTGTLSASESSCHIALAIQGWSGSLADVQVSTITTASSTDQADPGSVAASWGSDDNLFIAAAIADYWNQTATAFPANYSSNQTTQEHSNQFGGTQAVSTATRNLAAASDDPSAFTLFDPSTSQSNAAYTIVVKPAAPSGPTLSSVPATAFPGQSRTVTGTGFGATQGTGGVTVGGVAQTITSWSDTSITFTTVLGNNSYGIGKVVELTTDTGGTDTGMIELVANTTNGFGFVTMSSPNTTDESSVAFGATPTVVTGDQFEWEDFDDLGNLVVGADAFVSSVDTVGVFRGRFWDATDGTWGAVGEFTVQIEGVTSPSITSIDVPAAGSYKAGDVLTFTSNFDESVDVTGTPAINFSVDGSPRQANYSSGTGSSALVFTYTVQSGDDTDGLSITSLSLDGGTIADAAGNAADLTLVSVGDTSGIIIDTIAPVVGVANVTTTNTAPILSGTASGVDQVSVVVNSVTYTPAVVGGTWSQQLPTLAVNNYPVTVDATDDAGNAAVQSTATLSIVDAGSGFIVAKANAAGNSLWGSIGMPEGALVSLIDDDSGSVTLNADGELVGSKASSVATLDVDGTSVRVFVRPSGVPVKPFYKVNWQIIE